MRVASCEAFHYLLRRRSRNSIVRPEIAPRIVVVIGAAQGDAMVGWSAIADDDDKTPERGRGLPNGSFYGEFEVTAILHDSL